MSITQASGSIQVVQGDCYPCSLKHGLFSANPPFSKVGMFPRGSGAEDAATSVLGALEAEPGPREPREVTARGGRLIQVQPHHPRGSGVGESARRPRPLRSGP